MTHFQNTTRIRIATITIAALALVLTAALPARAEGVITEMVWVNGAQVRMTFPQSGNQFPATPNAKVDNFYVMAPQTGTPQFPLPFPHDHVVGVSPPQNHGDLSVFWHGFLVLCSAQGITSGGCVPTVTSTPFGTIPLAKTVNGQMLTSVDPIESPANSGLLVLFDTGVVFLGTINSGK
jgi:hypothetical protein